MNSKRSIGQFPTLWVLGALLTIGCSLKNPIEKERAALFVSECSLPDMLYLESDDNYRFTVKVVHTEGVGVIRIVKALVLPIEGQTILYGDTLEDTGSNGDAVPKDGIFCGHLSLAFAQGRTGTYQMSIIAEDIHQNVSDTLSVTLTVVNGRRGEAPILFECSLSDTLNADSLGHVFLTIRVEDLQGLNDIDSVFFQIYQPLSPVPFFQSQMWDQGQSGDLIPGNGVFTFQGNLEDTLKSRGIHAFRFQAVDKSGLFSDAKVKKVFIDQINYPPVLSNVNAPDTVILGAAGDTLTLFISVDVFDPQGLADIKKVYFNSTKPNGTADSGNPFPLYDNGTHGDIIPHDGIYSLEVIIISGAQTGVYRFDFYAEDYSGAVSEPLTHFITVVE